MASGFTVSGCVVRQNIVQRNVGEESCQPPAYQGKTESEMRMQVSLGV